MSRVNIGMNWSCDCSNKSMGEDIDPPTIKQAQRERLAGCGCTNPKTWYITTYTRVY